MNKMKALWLSLGAAALIVVGLACGSDAEPTSAPLAAEPDRDMVSIPAPIESVEIEKVSAKPPNSTLIIVSGGLNSCESFKDYTLTRDGATFRVQVTNSRQVDPDVECTATYGTVTHRIPLPSDVIEACKTYTVEVNGELRSVPSSCPSVESGLFSEPTPTLTTMQPSLPAMVKVPAPILSVEILVAESFPLQYFLQVESGLRNGCIEFDGYEVEQEGETITVTVTNLEPADKDIMCTEEYRTVTTNIPLGNGLDFEPATTYTVLVNDATTSFTTGGEAPEPDQVTATLGSPFQLKAGQTAMIDHQGPKVVFVEVVEDSRCAKDVTCIWAGRARILVRVSSPGDILGFGIPELTLEAGRVDLESNTVTGVFDQYLFELSVLDPYPQAVAQEPQDYTATVVVTKTPRTR